MEINISGAELKIDSQITGNALKLSDVSDFSKGLVEAKNMNVAFSLIYSIAYEALSNEFSNVDENSKEAKICLEIVNMINKYDKEKHQC